MGSEELVGGRQQLLPTLSSGLSQADAGAMKELVGEGVRQKADDFLGGFAALELVPGLGEHLIAQVFGPVR